MAFADVELEFPSMTKIFCSASVSISAAACSESRGEVFRSLAMVFKNGGVLGLVPAVGARGGGGSEASLSTGPLRPLLSAPWLRSSDPFGRLRAKAEKEEAGENYGGPVLALWDFGLTFFLALEEPNATDRSPQSHPRHAGTSVTATAQVLLIPFAVSTVTILALHDSPKIISATVRGGEEPQGGSARSSANNSFRSAGAEPPLGCLRDDPESSRTAVQ